MEITSSNITKDSITLVTNSPVAGLVLSYGKKLKQQYVLNDINASSITISKEALELDSLDNLYFKLYLFDEDYAHEIYKGLYSLNVQNNKSQYDYDARNLKQELDNLNYYDGVLNSLTEKESFLEANDFFFNYLEFLEKKLNGNNFIQNIQRQAEPIVNTEQRD
jgi:hypothetical protein